MGPQAGSPIYHPHSLPKRSDCIRLTHILWVVGAHPVSKGGWDMMLLTNHVMWDLTKICIYVLTYIYTMMMWQDWSLWLTYSARIRTHAHTHTHTNIYSCVVALMIVCWEMQLRFIPLKHNFCSTVSFWCLHQNTLQCSTAISLQVNQLSFWPP